MTSIVWRDESLLLSDGVVLKSRLWHPTEGGPWPTLLMRQPYGREIASTVTYLHPSWWANNGYLVIVQDVRGQGDSSGYFGGFKQEAADTSESHLWVRSLSECNGLLGTYGFSYQGLTQLVALEGTPPPDCMAPAMTGLNEFEHWSCDGGAFWWDIGLSWGLQLAAMRARKEGNSEGWSNIRRSLDTGSYLYDGLELLLNYDPENMVLGWLNQSISNQGKWLEHKPLGSWLRQPMLLIGGWSDPHLKGIIHLFKESVKAGGKPQLHIGPATHLTWWKGVQETHLKFFNRYLRSQPSKKENTLSINLWNSSRNEWQDSSIDKQKQEFWGLFSTGKACLDNNDGLLRINQLGNGSLHIVHDPWRPVPSVGGHLTIRSEESQQSKVDNRSDVATFTSESFSSSHHLEGIPILELSVKSDQESFDICTTLSVFNNKSKEVRLISTGVKRLNCLKVNQICNTRISLQPILIEVQKGEHIRLSIAGSSWPSIGVNSGKRDKLCGPPDSNCLVITLTLDLSKSKFELLPLLN